MNERHDLYVWAKALTTTEGKDTIQNTDIASFSSVCSLKNLFKYDTFKLTN